MKKFEAKYFWLTVPAIVALVSIVKIWPVLPAVMQDEYIYSTQSRFVPFAQQLYPNYLFSWLYSGTSGCGLGFYDCAKGINAAFFIGMLFIVWLIANRLFGNTIAVFASSITALSPISVYVSYFMPESMYYFFIALTIWLALRAARSPSWRNWIFVAVSLGLTSLIKPHALFALPAFLLFGLIADRKAEGGSWAGSLVKQVGVLGAFLLVKFGLGFAFAGPAGFTFFGGSYGASINEFFNKVAAGSVAVSQAVASSAGQVFAADAAPGASPAGAFFSVAIMQLLAQAGLVLLIAGLPVLLSLRVTRTVLKSSSPVGEQSAFVMLIGFIAIAMVLFVPMFEGLITSIGDDHSHRMLLRYYEFLLPFLVMLGFSMDKFVEPKTASRIWQTGLVLVASIFALVWIPANIESNFSDSILVIGLLSSPAAMPVFFAFTLIGVLIWQFKPELGAKVNAWAVIALIVLLVGQFAQNELLTRVGTQKAFFDVAGQASQPLLKDIPGEKILVVGTTRTYVYTSKFWIDKPYIADKLIAQDGVIPDDFVAGYGYVLILGTSTMQKQHEIISSGDRYSLVKLN